MLSPSRGLGGGIERYVETVEWAHDQRGCRMPAPGPARIRYPSSYPAARPGPGHPASRAGTHPAGRRAPGAAAGGDAAGQGFGPLRGVGRVSRPGDMGFTVAAQTLWPQRPRGTSRHRTARPAPPLHPLGTDALLGLAPARGDAGTEIPVPIARISSPTSACHRGTRPARGDLRSGARQHDTERYSTGGMWRWAA